MASKPLSEDVIKLFTDIFRFILPDVDPEHKELLAPGELGINYATGVFYFKDPTTLEIRTPNSIEALKFIEEKYNYDTGELNADRIGNLRFYSSVLHVPDITDLNSVTVDTIISKMAQPAVLIAHTESTEYKALGLPAENGLLTINKITDYATSLSFVDSVNHISYLGQYDAATRQFLYWIRDEDSMQNFATAEGNGTSQSVTIDKDLEDLFVMVVKLTNDVQPTATWTFNGSKEYVLTDLYGKAIKQELLTANSIIMLIRDELLDRWILADMSKNIIYQTAQLIDKRLEKALANVPSRVNVIENWLSNDANKLNVISTVFECTADNTSTIPVNDLDIDSDVLLVNYNQTVLRFGIDYSVATDGASISLLNGKLSKGDELQLIIIKHNKFTISNG